MSRSSYIPSEDNISIHLPFGRNVYYKALNEFSPNRLHPIVADLFTIPSLRASGQTCIRTVFGSKRHNLSVGRRRRPGWVSKILCSKFTVAAV